MNLVNVTRNRGASILSVVIAVAIINSVPLQAGVGPRVASTSFEYLWYEAENMRGFSTNERHEPVLNPSHLMLPSAKAPGWGINGPGVSAEWSQGGESEWNSAAASADERRALIYQDLEVPRNGSYKFWVRYADWAGMNENFTVVIRQNEKEVFRHEFGASDVIDPHDEVSMYWQWAFAWDFAAVELLKGPARVHIEIEKSTAARRHVDCFVITDDTEYIPRGRQKPIFAATRYMNALSNRDSSLTPLLSGTSETFPAAALPSPTIAGKRFLIPWNVAKAFWEMYEKPEKDRPLYPFNSELIDEFVKSYAGKRDVPIFSSKLIVPVIYINDVPLLMKEGSQFLRYLRETHAPFAILINYGAATFSEADGQAVWRLLNGEFKNQFLGWISGESIGYVWPPNAVNPLNIDPAMTRREMLDALHRFYTEALDKKWSNMFHTPTGAMWDKMIPAQSTSSTSFAHALGEWGCKILGIETAAVQPGFAMRIAFTRGAARQFGSSFLYYHAPNFGDTATTFTNTQNFAGPNNFYHSRYGSTMGPSLSWYRKSYYLYYMAGASAMYPEQGFDQFFKPGPGDHPFQLNPLGRITDEFIRFAERHPDPGIAYTPVAFLLDPAHGFEMTDYPHWPFGVSQINLSDRALRELFGAAYYPMLVNEGEPATADRQAFVSAKFGDIFDVIVASDKGTDALTRYRAVVVGGDIEWSPAWVKRLADYVRAGGVVLLNAAQIKGLPAELSGVKSMNSTAESSRANCMEEREGESDLGGQVFRYQRVVPSSGVQVLMRAPNGDPLVTINTLGKGKVVFNALPHMLGIDERMTPFSAHLLAHLFRGATPVEVNGDVEYLVNRSSKGWVITLFNNRGVYKPQQGLADVKRDEVADVELAVKGADFVEAREWVDQRKLDMTRENGRAVIKTRIAPGGISVIELVQR
jgi:hypothetical protein